MDARKRKGTNNEGSDRRPLGIGLAEGSTEEARQRMLQATDEGLLSIHEAERLSRVLVAVIGIRDAEEFRRLEATEKSYRAMQETQRSFGPARRQVVEVAPSVMPSRPVAGMVAEEGNA